MNTQSPKPRAGYKGTQYLPFPRSRRSILFVFSAEAVLVGCFLFLYAWSVQSQPPSSASTQPGTAAVAPKSSTILITARLKDGTPAGLSTSDIEIEADGKSVPVDEVVGGAPLHYCLLFDISGSLRDRFKLQQDEAIELLSKVVKAGSDHGMLVAFNDNYYLDGEGTNPQQFVNRIATEQPQGRGTALYDAVVASADHMSKSSPDPGPRVMFLFSHGEDNASVLSQDKAVQFVQKAGIRIYVIGSVKAAKTLRKLAKRTGGKAYFPEQKDVGKAVADIADDLTTLPGQKRDGQLHNDSSSTVIAQSPTDKPAPSETLDSSYSTALSTSPHRSLLVEAMELYRKGDFRGAITKYKNLLQEKPTSPDGWTGLIRSYLKNKDVGLAAQSAEQALAVSDHPRIHVARAEVLFRQGEILRAEKEWVDVVNSGYPEARAYLGLARIRRATAMYNGAEKMINQAHELNPADPDIKELWLMTLARAQRIEQLKRFLAEEPNLDASQRAELSSYLDLLDDWSKQKEHQCRLVSKVTVTETPLVLLKGAQHIRGYGLSVALNGHGDVLLLDTGASGIVVGRRVAEQAGISNVIRTRLRGIGGSGLTGGSVGFAESIKIGEMEFHNCPITITDTYLAADGDGLIGADVFDEFLVDINFPDEKLKLSELPKRPGEREREVGLANGYNDSEDKQPGENPAQDRYIAPEMQSFTRIFRFGHLLLVPTSIGNVPPKLFLIDTGGLNNTISPSAAEEVTKVRRDPNMIMSGISGTVDDVYSANKTVLRFGHFSEKNQQMFGFDTTSLSDSAGTEISGFLGFSTLRMFDIKIDYRDGLVDFSYDAKKWNVIKRHQR
jgi:thioredoxin-like negative regulator of GroEL